MTEHIQAPESDEEIHNLSNAEFKTLVIRMLKKLIELVPKMKAIQSEIKENIQGTNSEGKETRTKSMILNKRKK